MEKKTTFSNPLGGFPFFLSCNNPNPAFMKYWLILLFALSGLHAQSTLESEKHWFYTHYYEAEQPLRPAQLWQRLEIQISSHALAQNAHCPLASSGRSLGSGHSNRPLG